jgi:VanZ family protein
VQRQSIAAGTGRARLLAAVWAAVIAAFLLVPLPPEQEDYLPHWLARLLGGGADALVHGVLFFAFAYFLLGALGGRHWRKSLAFVLAVAYGALTEWLQPRVSGRSSEWTDLVADAVGALAGVAVVALLERARNRSRSEASLR